MNKRGYCILFVMFAVLAAAQIPAYSAPQKETGITGAVNLGMTRTQVIKILGKPQSPQEYDFFYTKGNDELIVCFNEKSRLVEAVIVRGTGQIYSLGGVKLGSPASLVKQAYGEPEKVVEYKKSNVACWYYPSKNVCFALNGDKVKSFSVSNCSVGR